MLFLMFLVPLAVVRSSPTVSNGGGMQRQALYDTVWLSMRPQPPVLVFYIDGMDQNTSALICRSDIPARSHISLIGTKPPLMNCTTFKGLTTEFKKAVSEMLAGICRPLQAFAGLWTRRHDQGH